MKKRLCLLLALLMLAPAVISCSDGGNGDEGVSNTENTVTDASADTDDSAEETEISRANYPDTLPDDLDFGGATVNIHSRGDDQAYLEIGIEEMTGEPVNDAIYERNQMINDRLNVVLAPLSCRGLGKLQQRDSDTSRFDHGIRRSLRYNRGLVRTYSAAFSRGASP